MTGEPFTMWALDAPFDKYGVPRMGSVGASIGQVVVFRAEEFKRLLAAVPGLATTQFRLGQYEAEPAESKPDPNAGRCDSVSDQGLRCGSHAGHKGPHNALFASDDPWGPLARVDRGKP